MDQVFDDFLPEDISLAQIPKRFKIGNHSISVEGSTIHDAKGQIDKILFTIVDITALEQVEAENKSNRAVVRIMQNISAFHDFVRESNSRIVQALTALQSGNDPIVRRELHTLKGNSAAFGLDGISTLIHHIEDQSWISNENLSAIELEFRSFLDQNFEMFKMRFGEESDRRFSIDSHDIDQLIDTTKDASSSEALKSAVRSWIKAIQKVPIAEVLGPIEGYIAKIAHERNRLLNFKIEGGELKVDRDEVKDIAQNLIHLIRNAVDHGIEPPEERENKSATGSIILSFEETPNNLVITLKDDGRGIDTQRVRQKAVAMKIISQQKADAMSESEALQLIFSDGLSTASSVSDVSGRGVGMKAIEDAVKIRNGSIEISSELGKGTTFRIALPDLKTHSTKMAA